MLYRNNFRGSAEWRAEGLPIRSSTSDTAIKLYDSALTQLVGWYDDPNSGGLTKTCTDMLSADPEFVLGRSLSVGLQVLGIGTSTGLNNLRLKSEAEALTRLAESKKDQIGDREYRHVQAVNKFVSGDWLSAADIWQGVLVDYPTDMQALKFSHDTLTNLVKQPQNMDSIARVLPVWNKSSLPLESYVHGMYAFGLEEANHYNRAEREAKLALVENANDAWATHALSHIYVMEGRVKEGIQWMSSTQSDWEVCNYLASHNFWHWALFHIEQEEYETAVDLFETEICSRALKNRSMLEIWDSTSLLYRLDLIKPKQFVTSKHWEDTYSVVKPHLSDHSLGFSDAHFMMSCLGGQHMEEAKQLIETIDPTVSSDTWVKVTVPLLEAMVDYNEERYAKAVDKLNSIRYDVLNIGGSNAQRDVFNQLLIVAALKSPADRHKRLSQRLLAERTALNDSPFNRTLISVQ